MSLHEVPRLKGGEKEGKGAPYAFGIIIEIFSLVFTSRFCSDISIINLCLQVTFASPLCSKVNPKYK